jgi:hypothetical protein
MVGAKVEGLPGGVFRVRPEHNPKTKSEKYKRVHYLVCRLGLAVSDRLQEALVDLRRQAYQAPSPELEQLALKGYSEDEFVGAVKEILCIWLHQEAVDQGGPQAPPWLISFLRIALGATDILIPYPRAMDVFAEYSDCDDMRSLCREAAVRAAGRLGFGENSEVFAAAVVGLLVYNREDRQRVLQDALTLPIGEIQSWHAA